MKISTASLFVLFLVFAPVQAAPPSLKIPAEVKPSGQYAEVSPDTDAVSVTYVGLSGVDPIPSRVLNDKRLFLLDTRGLGAGKYRFAAVGASKDGDQLRVDFLVIVGDPGPDPGPGPGPGPGPVPPPIDPLTKQYQEAFNKESDGKKVELCKALVAVYKQASLDAEAPEVKTWGNLFTVIGAVQDKLGTRGKLTGIQAVSQTIMKDRFPTDASKTLTLDDRKLAADTFRRFAAALEGVK